MTNAPAQLEPLQPLLHLSRWAINIWDGGFLREYCYCCLLGQTWTWYGAHPVKLYGATHLQDGDDETLVMELQLLALQRQELREPVLELGWMSKADVLDSMQPGRDGSQPVPRAQAEHYEIPAGLSADDREALKVQCVNTFALYVASGFQQQGVTDILKRDRISPCVPQHLRSAFPATFKQLLRALELFKYPVRTAKVYDYIRCRCGFLFRYVSQICDTNSKQL